MWKRVRYPTSSAIGPSHSRQKAKFLIMIHIHDVMRSLSVIKAPSTCVVIMMTETTLTNQILEASPRLFRSVLHGTYAARYQCCFLFSSFLFLLLGYPELPQDDVGLALAPDQPGSATMPPLRLPAHCLSHYLHSPQNPYRIQSWLLVDALQALYCAALYYIYPTHSRKVQWGRRREDLVRHRRDRV